MFILCGDGVDCRWEQGLVHVQLYLFIRIFFVYSYRFFVANTLMTISFYHTIRFSPGEVQGSNISCEPEEHTLRN